MIANKLMRRMHKGQKGITGLETAIILIAFVVVASVFAYTVLSAGLFSTQKSQEAVYSGLEETRSSLEVKGAVLGEGVSQLDTCDAPWTADGSNTAAQETTDYIEASGSAKLTVAGTPATGLFAHYDITTGSAAYDLSDCSTVRYWIKSGSDLSSTVSDGDLELLLSEEDDGTGTTESFDIAAADLDGNWNYVSENLSGTTTNYDAVKSVALNIAADGNLSGGEVIYVDAIETEAFQDIDDQPTSYADNVVFTVSNVLGGEPVDFSGTSDSDSDGDLGDESTQSHKVIVSYSDKYQQADNVAWTKSAIGNDDGDDLLEQKEKFQITVDLKNINNGTPTASEKVSEDRTFTLEVKPQQGGALTIERTMPEIIHAIDNLR